MDDLVRSIDTLIAESPEANALRKDTQLKPIIGSFFNCVREQKLDQKIGCIQANKSANKHCKKINQSILNAQDPADYPEVLAFNLNWPSRSPDSTNVLKSLVSIPEIFNVSDLYEFTA